MTCLPTRTGPAMPEFAVVPHYALTIAVDPAGGGTTTPTAGTSYHPEGSVIDITATPAYGYGWDEWTGDCSGAGACQVTMDADKTVTANFINKWWDPGEEGLCVWAAYQPKGAADLASSYVDVSGNGNNCGPGVAPTWDAVNGWKFNGTTQYLTTAFVPQNDQSQSALVQFTSFDGQTWRALFGARDAGLDQRWYVMPHSATPGVVYANGTSPSQAPSPVLQGNLGVAGNQGYRNGVADGGAIGAWGAAIALNTFIGGYNNGGALVPTNVYIQAFAIYDCTLTPVQVAAIAARMAAL